MSAPLIFDRALVRRRLSRALREGYQDFLLQRAADDLDERLGAILRTFPLALDLGSPAGIVASRLAEGGKAGTVVRLAGAIGPLEAASCIGDEEALPFAPERFDLVASLLTLHAVNDLPGALAQIRRALRPDGLFMACLLGGNTLGELRQALVTAESEREGGASPRVAPFADLREYGALLQRAGFALPVADVETVTVRYGDPLGLLRDLRGMGFTNALVGRSRRPLRRETFLRAMRFYAETFADADGRVRATFDLVWLSGWAPHDSQQKPLRPGSATMRLADALGVTELKTGEKPG